MVTETDDVKKSIGLKSNCAEADARKNVRTKINHINLKIGAVEVGNHVFTACSVSGAVHQKRLS